MKQNKVNRFLKSIAVLCFLLLAFYSFGQNVSINTDGSAPDNSAMLDVSSTTQGALLPRMTMAQRNLIANPATGLLVFQIDNTPGFYINLGTTVVPNWQKLIAGDETPVSIEDTDGDTQIQVEESANDDIIRFDNEGNETFTFTRGKINVLNSSGSIYLGNNAGQNDDFTSTNNVGIGSLSLSTNATTGSNNVAVGSSALRNSTASNNVAIGSNSMFANSTGSLNTAVGFSALQSNTTGVQNVAMGYQALRTAIGNNNTAIGYFSGRGLTSGSGNTLLGIFSGSSNSGTMTNNTFVGSFSGQIYTGNNSVFLGTNAGNNAVFSADNLLVIENSNSVTPLIYGDFANDSVKIFGTLSVGNTFSFPTTDGTANQVLQTDGSGNVDWVNISSDTDWNITGNIVNNTTNQFAMGVASIPASYLAEFESSSAENYPIALSVDNNYTGAAQTFGLVTDLSNAGTGQKFGVFNAVRSNAAQTNEVFGTYNNMEAASNESIYGTYNNFLNTGVGRKTGVLNFILSPSGTTLPIIGVDNPIVNQGSGETYGMRTTINTIGTGDKYGVFSDISVNGGSSSKTFGTRNRMNVDGSGDAFGVYLDYSQANGTGTHYGIYSDGEDNNYFSGNVGIGTENPSLRLTVETASDNYGIEHTDGTVEIQTFINSSGSVPDGGWIGTRSNHPFYLYTDDDNPALTITAGNTVGIGASNTSPSSTLDVAGDIETGATDAFYFGDPSTDGTWRIIRDGNDLSFERRESGTYVFKMKINP